MAEEQDHDATQTASTIREMTDAMRGMAEKVNLSMEKSQGARQEAEQGTDVVRQTIACIGQVTEQTAQIAESHEGTGYSRFGYRKNSGADQGCGRSDQPAGAERRN